ncbi:MAG: hypothetical protein ACT4P7_11885 [Gemmatimonadaceae bacterium]
MPSSTEFFQELQKANVHLSAIEGDIDALRTSMENNTAQLVTIGTFTNSALVHQIRQNETIICLLKQIADHTCRLVIESHTQTGLQTRMASDVDSLEALYALTHAEAALVRQREEALRVQLEACCPPKPQPPACLPEKCVEPGPFDKPPVILKPAPGRKDPKA